MKRIFSILLLFFLFFSLSAQKQKVIFDCDLGSDIDDAYALALLLSCQDELEILGLCMDHGNTPGRAKLATKMLYKTGLESIPVFVGRATPGMVSHETQIEGLSHQMMWAMDFTTVKPQQKSAADFIIESLNKYPGEVILFTVGPVDNMADIMEKDPQALKNAKQVISMFGSIETGYGGGEPSAEWNVRASVEAAQKFMSSGANILLAPLDCTDHVVLNDKMLNAISNRQTPLTDALAALFALWYYNAEYATQAKMFDGVAIGMLLWPELFETKKAFVYVDDLGFTKIDKDSEPNCTVGMKIDDKEFLRRMYRKIVEQNFSRE